jgi:hypothetical protein
MGIRILSTIAILSWLLTGVALSRDSVPHDENTAAQLPWKYRMTGNLAGANLVCTGNVMMHRNEDACWFWELPRRECKGESSVDWLHDIEPAGKICRVANGWELQTLLPGNSFCIVHPTADHVMLEKGFELHCTWRCRSSSFPCEGSATYWFLPPSLSKP